MIELTRKRVKKLLKNKNFKKALRRDVGMDPEVLRASLNKNKKIGKNTPISKKLFNKLKNDKLFKKRELLRSGVELAKKNKNCAFLVGTIIFGAEMTSDVEVDFDQKDINRQIKEDEKDELNEKMEDAVSNMEKLNIEKIGCGPNQIVPSELPEDEIEVHCAVDESKSEEEKLKEDHYQKIAVRLLKEREKEAQELLPNPLAEDYELKSAFLLNQIKNIKTYLKKDEQGCFNAYEGFEDAILFSKEPEMAKKKKAIDKPDDCIYDTTLFGRKNGIRYGKDCYAQRYNCMDKRQQGNFEKLKDRFEFEDPEENPFLIKFPVYNSDTKKIEENYSYEKGNYYDIQGVNELSKSYEVKRTKVKGSDDLVEEKHFTPEYFMKSNGGAYSKLNLDNNRALKKEGFKKPKYPFFRPTDQCSISMQEGGGVCFQEACRQHDLCFQTLPDTKTTSFDQHFNKCNNVFERNIGQLCDQNKKEGFFGWTDNISCHSMKKVFYAGVQWGESLMLDKGGSFTESQRDQHGYLVALYEDLYLRV